MVTSTRPRLSTLTGFAYQLNMWLEDDAHGLTFDDIRNGLDQGTLYDVLKRQIPRIDIGLFADPQYGQSAQLLQTLKEASELIRGRETRKTGVERSGLALLMTFVLEAIQQEWWEPDSYSRLR
jgi:hypothetical protein